MDHFHAYTFVQADEDVESGGEDFTAQLDAVEGEDEDELDASEDDDDKSKKRKVRLLSSRSSLSLLR